MAKLPEQASHQELSQAADLVALAALDRLDPVRAQVDAALPVAGNEQGLASRALRLMRRIGLVAPSAVEDALAFRQASLALWNRGVDIATAGDPATADRLHRARDNREALRLQGLAALELAGSAESAHEAAGQADMVARQVAAWDRPGTMSLIAIGYGAVPLADRGDLDEGLLRLQRRVDRLLAGATAPAATAALAGLAPEDSAQHERLKAASATLATHVRDSKSVDGDAVSAFCLDLQADLQRFATGLRREAQRLDSAHRVLDDAARAEELHLLAKAAGEEPEAQRLVARLADDRSRIEALTGAPLQGHGTRIALPQPRALMAPLATEGMPAIPFMAASPRLARRKQPRPGF